KGQAAPFYASDGAIVVYAPLSKAVYRAPVLSFANQRRDELQRALRMKLGTAACPLEIMIGGRSDGDTRVLTARLREPGVGLRERIELPDPEAADLDQFRRAISFALLRAWMVAAGGTEESMRDLPVWLIDGALRHIDRERRQADIDRALLLWSRACLPTALELFAADSVAATREPAVAAVLAGWFIEKRAGLNVFEELLRSAATGTVWSPAVAARLLADTEDMTDFDRHVDARFLAEGRVVVTPGLTSAGIVRRFRSNLLLAPAYFGKLAGNKRTWYPLAETLDFAGDADMRRSAAEQSLKVKMAAVGRDGMLIAVADAYALFMERLAAGDKPDRLAQLLAEAELMRGELERVTAKGAVVQRGGGV
ncbi:MAG: hypothetical protein PHU80_05470, partial [Kiritimatiellae bacterium]|nr:hypothetical protein [Kiritimatiellia bacterium]